MTDECSSKPFDWGGRRVFLTGHTGFKGGWLALWLASKGAMVRGYGLDPNTMPNLMAAARIANCIEDIRGDIRDVTRLEAALLQFAPETVFHLAAQPLVRLSYADPVGTFETNVIGTARVLDAVRRTPSVRAVVVVTTDKCYDNQEWAWGYRESDRLGGCDPYSSSKACTELVAAAYRQSYFSAPGKEVALATARAGNVIGGGDWSVDRLVPDLMRGFTSGTPVAIRRPQSVRPWQHVLEPLTGYLLLAEKLLGPQSARYATAYNFGPGENDNCDVAWIASYMARRWGTGAAWRREQDVSLHEATQLKLDASRARVELGWTPRLTLAHALDSVVDWYRAYHAGEDMRAYTLREIATYEALAGGPSAVPRAGVL